MCAETFSHLIDVSRFQLEFAELDTDLGNAQITLTGTVTLW
jgi:hypothetical protein